MRQAVTTTQILIIDDDEGQHLILEHQLKLSGYAVLHAYSGQEALEIAATTPVDLIILDINMPGMDGFQTLTSLRAKTGLADIPVIFLSSLNRQYLKIKGLEGGGDDYITKPFDSAELTARIKAVLRRARKPAAVPPGTMQGRIEAVGLAELLQGMALAAKTCTITFPEMAGEIAIKAGAIVRIRQGRFRGRQALIRLILRQHGTFLARYDILDETASEENSTIEHLLLYSVSQADEFRERARQLGPDNMVVRLTGEATDFPAIQAVADAFPMALFDLLTSMPGDLPDNVTLVATARARGIIDYQAASEDAGPKNRTQE